MNVQDITCLDEAYEFCNELVQKLYDYEITTVQASDELERFTCHLADLSIKVYSRTGHPLR